MKKFFVVFLFLAAFAQAKTVDIVIKNGTVLTMAGPNIANGGVAIDKGKIVAVGDVSGYQGKETPREIYRAGLKKLGRFHLLGTADQDEKFLEALSDSLRPAALTDVP